MATANIESLGAILKDFYLGPLQEQLNNEVLALDLFEKATVDWNGKQVIIPVHVGRNTGVNFVGEGEDLPTPTRQTFKNLTVTAKFLYGKFQITGPAISAAKSGGKNSFIGYVDAEMNKLVDDVRNSANSTVFSGGRICGFFNEKKNGGADEAWDFTGDIQKVSDNLAGLGDGADTAMVKLIRMDSYEEHGDGDVSLVSVDVSAGTLNINGINTTSAGWVAGGGAGALPATINDDVAIAVVLSSDNAANAALLALDDEPTGIFGNLATTSHFGVDRGDNAADATALQSVCKVVSSARADVTLGSLQNLLDDISVASDGEPEVFLVHPSFRQAYAGILMATTTAHLTKEVSNVGKADGGFASLSYNNIPFRVSRAAPKGAVVALSTKTWKLAELESGGFADLDGAVLSRDSDSDQWSGFYRWYYDTVCLRPGANGILAGLNYAGAS